MNAHRLAELLLAGPNLPVVTKQGHWGLVEIDHIKNNFKINNSLISWFDDQGVVQYDKQALILESTG